MIIGDINDTRSIVFEGNVYEGIRKIGIDAGGAFVISLYTTPPHDKGRGGYFTCLPISGKEYRKENPTKTSYRILSKEKIAVYSDWGEMSVIKANTDVIDRLAEECIENGIPLLDQPR